MEEYDILEDEYCKSYYKKGTRILHRLDGPSIEWKSGAYSWFMDGKLHRLNGPAVEGMYGFKSWWINGKRHRLDGPAVIFSDVIEQQLINGTLHRLDGPAIELQYKDNNQWWINGARPSPAKEIIMNLWYDNKQNH